MTEPPHAGQPQDARIAPRWYLAGGLAVLALHLPLGLSTLDVTPPRWDRWIALIASGQWDALQFTHPPAYFNAMALLYRAATAAAGWGTDDLSVQVAYLEHPRFFTVLGTLVGVALGAVCVIASARLAERLAGARAAAYAGLLAASSTVLAYWSGMTAVDVAAGTIALVATNACIDFARTLDRRSTVLAGVSCALACATNWNLVFVLFGLAAALHHAQRQPGARPPPVVLKELLITGLVTVTVAAPQLVLSPQRVWSDLAHQLETVGQITEFREANSGALFYFGVLSDPVQGVGAAVLVLSLAGLVVAARRDRTAARIAALFPFCFVGFLNLMRTKDDHWLIAALPFFHAFAGVGLAAAFEWIRRRHTLRKARLVTGAVCLSSLLVLGAMTAVLYPPPDLSEGPTERLAAWMQQHVPAGTGVIADHDIDTVRTMMVPPGLDKWASGRQRLLEQGRHRKFPLRMTLSFYPPHTRYDALQSIASAKADWLVLSWKSQEMYLELGERDAARLAGHRRFHEWLAGHARIEKSITDSAGRPAFDIYRLYPEGLPPR